MRILGNIEIEGQRKNLSIQKDNGLYKYYLDDQFIGVFDPKKMIDTRIVFRENSIENELSAEIKDQITQFLGEKQLDEILDEKEQEQKEFEYDEVLDDREEKSEQENDKQPEKDQVQKEKDKPTEDLEEDKKFVNTVKDINIKETIKMSEKITDMRTLGKVLDDEGKRPTINGKKAEKLGIVESDQIQNLVDENGKRLTGHTSRYATVGINNRGEVAAMDLEQDSSEGSNSTKRNYQVAQDGEITKDDVSTRLKVGKGTLGIENEGGEIKVHHSSGKSFGGQGVSGNMSLDRELGNSRTGNLMGMKKDVRDLASDVNDGYRNVENIYQEAEKHKEYDCEDYEIDDIDGDENTASHTHEEENVNFEELAQKWRLRDDNGNFSAEKAKKLYDEAKKDSPNKTSEQIIEQIDDELNEQVMQGRSR